MQHCVQIALLGGGWRWGGDEGPFGPLQRRLKCKSPLRMCISTIYEYLLIFFLPLSLSSVLSLFPSSSLFGVFAKRQNFCLKCAFHSPKCFSYFFFICSMLHYFTTFWWQFYWPFFVGEEEKRNTFLCMQLANGKAARERERGQAREDYKNITELWAIFHRI